MTLYADQCVQREAHGDVRFSVETPVQGSSMHCNAARGMAAQCNSKQRGSSIGNSGFSGPLWSDGNAWQGNVMQGTGLQFKATRIVHWQQWIFRAALVPAQCNAPQINAPKGIASQSKAIQSNADRPLATAGFPGRFDLPGRVSPAALLTDTGVSTWQ